MGVECRRRTGRRLPVRALGGGTLALAAALAMGPAGCDRGSTPSAAGSPTATRAPSGTPSVAVWVTTSAGAQACAALAKLTESVNALRELDVVRAGTDALKAAVQQVRADLSAFAGAAAGLVGPQLAALQAAVDALRSTASGLSTADELRAARTELAAEIAAVQATWAALRQTLAGRCP